MDFSTFLGITVTWRFFHKNFKFDTENKQLFTYMLFSDILKAHNKVNMLLLRDNTTVKRYKCQFLYIFLMTGKIYS